MKSGQRKDYITYRFQRSKEAYDEAKILAENQKWNAVINRLYYSCFYAVIALLIKNGIETNSHNGTRTQFGLNYVRTGKISKVNGKLFTKLFDYRQKGDYGDMFDFDEDITLPLIEQVDGFLREIENELNND